MPGRIYGNTDNAPLAPGLVEASETAECREGVAILIQRRGIVRDTGSGLAGTAGPDRAGVKIHGSGGSLSVDPNDILRPQ
jgi:hypothetical protein